VRKSVTDRNGPQNFLRALRARLRRKIRNRLARVTAANFLRARALWGEWIRTRAANCVSFFPTNIRSHPRGPFVSKRPLHCERTSERAHAHHGTAALPLVQALEISLRIISDVHLQLQWFERARLRSWTDCGVGGAGGGGGGGCGPSGASAADPQGALLGGADASSQLGQRNSTSEACRCQMCVAFECGCTRLQV